MCDGKTVYTLYEEGGKERVENVTFDAQQHQRIYLHHFNHLVPCLQCSSC